MRRHLRFVHLLTAGLGLGIILKIMAGYPSTVWAEDKKTPATTTPAAVAAPQANKGDTAILKSDTKASAHSTEAAVPVVKADERCFTGPLLVSANNKLEMIEKREHAVSGRERLLEIAERRINEQMALLDAMRKKIGETAGLAEKKIGKDRAKLISIYEQMKPKEAAGIFNEMDTTVASELLRNMREQSSSGILASMEPKKAYEVTVMLSSFLKQREQEVNALLPPNAAAALMKETTAEENTSAPATTDNNKAASAQ